MKKKFAAFVLCVICLVSAAGCGQAKTDEQTPPTDQSAVTDDYLTTISGTYVELFPELSKSEYRNIWLDATAPLVGAENAEATTDLLLGMCMAEPYGPEAAEKYEADPDSMAFNCCDVTRSVSKMTEIERRGGKRWDKPKKAEKSRDCGGGKF